MADWQDYTRRYGYDSLDAAAADVVHVIESTVSGARQRLQQYCAHATLQDKIMDPHAVISLFSVTLDRVPENELGGGQHRISILREVTFPIQGANANG